jgi:hypothetical protein
LELPESMAAFEDAIRSLEDAAEKTTTEFLSVNTIGGLILNLIIIALLPAIGEELFFRGVLFSLFKDWFKNAHWAVLITSILFSAAHLQFYGFLPRMLLGILFGYLLIWSGSIWIPILAHFVNNALAVSVFYFFSDREELLEQTDSFGSEPEQLQYLLIFTTVLVFLLFLFRGVGRSRNTILG